MEKHTDKDGNTVFSTVTTMEELIKAIANDPQPELTREEFLEKWGPMELWSPTKEE